MSLKRLSVMLIACMAFLFSSQAAFAGSYGAPAETAPPSDLSQKPVQIFDVQAGKVVKTMPNDDEFQKMAASWIGSVSGLAPQLSVESNCGYVYRVPLREAATIKLNEISVASDDLFLFYCADKPPMLLVFDGNRKPFLFLFKSDIKPFIRKTGIPAQ